ncbi:hypothetical protein [Campylobacter jejuni]|uniref:hypothetical protein n=1 Tax=Campylobacter jejuni TaxID=197 RepID=UPI0022EB6F4F|nr:hypothetical protein [Campylobacter jejuni]
MFISSKTELIQTIKNLTINNKEVKQIDFIYPNFSILHAILKNIDFHQRKMLSKNQILAMEILEILKQTCDNHNNIEVNIHTLNELDAGQNVNLKDLSSSEICTKVYLEDLEEEIQDKKQDKDLNLFYHTDKNNLCIEFINTLKELAKDSEDITTLDELIENIDPDNINSEKFDDFKKKVLEKIGNVIESDFFKNSISPTLKNTYEKFINELLEHIKKLAEEKEYEKIKIILSAIAGVAIATVVAVLTGGAGLAILAAGLFSLMGSASEYYEFAQRDYGTLLTPLAAFLATRCAMFIHYTYAKLNKLDLASIVTGEFVGIFLNYLFPTNFKALQEQYESIVYQLYTFKDDSPLAVIRDHFITYPFAINSKFISFDLKKIFYGIDLCTGVFDTHFSFHYEIDQKLEENKEFLLKRLLSYLIIDEKRNATALEDIKEQKYIIDDYTFYFKELKSLELKKCTIYQLPCNHPLFKEFRNKEKQISAFKKDEDSPIHAYNEALQILQDFANGLYNTSKDKTGRYIEDKNKTRRLLEKLNIIGQNNLKAMYMGINGNEESLKNKDNEEGNEEDIESVTKNKQSQKLPPNFIGRLATTIIIEDGLYMG